MDTDGGPNVGVQHHEEIGSLFLQRHGFSEQVNDVYVVISECHKRLSSFGQVCRLVESHVPAKRYLVAIEPAYERDLAADSIRSLTFQGGAMKPDEVTSFQAEDGLDIKLIFRSFDERGKDPSMVNRMV
jgi:predicted HD phosphohydrolase